MSYIAITDNSVRKQIAKNSRSASRQSNNIASNQKPSQYTVTDPSSSFSDDSAIATPASKLTQERVSFQTQLADKRRLKPDEIFSVFGHPLASRRAAPSWLPWYEDIAYKYFIWRGYDKRQAVVLSRMPRLIWPYESGFDFNAVNWGSASSPDGDARGIGQWRVSSWNSIKISKPLRKFLESSGIIKSFTSHPVTSMSKNQLQTLRFYNWPWTPVQKTLKQAVNDKTAVADVAKQAAINTVKSDLSNFGFPALQLISALPFIDEIWAFSQKKWAWNSVDKRWVYSGPLNPHISAIQPSAFKDYYTGMALIIFIGYGDGIGYFKSSKSLNHIGSKSTSKHKGSPDRYATVTRDALVDIPLIA